ncbi:MAG TPA: hypothetical protein VGX48_05980 [Pyrinomonadaceae bacterium]|nr:hypothetical protein [Pyrinomonadaceae bacterium]
MEDQPRQKLKEIIDTYGAAHVLADARRCEGMLRDLCGGYKRETHVLLCALRERVPHELLASSGVAHEVLCARLAARLHDELALTPEASLWAVAAWAAALGFITESEFTHLTATRPAAVGAQPTPPPPRPYRAPGALPEIRGLRLGAPLADVLKLFPGLQARPADDVGFRKIKLDVMSSFKTLYNTDTGAYLSEDVSPVVAGVSELELEFLDDCLTALRIEFDGTVKWNSIEEFAAKISEALGLSGRWADGRDNLYRNNKQLVTPRFRIEVSLYGPELRVQDVQAERVVAERQAAKEARQRQTFKL